MKVLVVEPDRRFSQKAANFFESHAHLTVQESSPFAAAQQAAKWRPDLVILAAEAADYDLTDSLKALRPRPAILLTGWLDRCDAAWRAWRHCGDELLIKPVFDSRELHMAMVKALQNANLAPEQKTLTAASA